MKQRLVQRPICPRAVRQGPCLHLRCLMQYLHLCLKLAPTRQLCKTLLRLLLWHLQNQQKLLKQLHPRQLKQELRHRQLQGSQLQPLSHCQGQLDQPLH